MGAHVHDEIGTGQDHLITWGEDRMRRHLRDVHLMAVPMSWDLGRLHQAHLGAHTTPTTAEEAPMTQTPHEHTAAEHRGDSPELARHLGKAHGYHSSSDLENFVASHRALHAAADAPDDQQVEADARALWAKETGRPEDSWASVTRDTRAHFRRKVRQKEIGYAAASREHEERYADRRIMVDRVTAVMAGLDFEREWAADDGIGPNVRGALRVTFQRAAEQTLGWLERGGLAAIPGYLDLLNEDVVRERDEALRQAALEKEAGREARVQMTEQHRSMQAMAQVQSDLENQLRALTEERDNLDRQLQMALSQKDGLFSEIGEIRARAEEAERLIPVLTAEGERVAELSTQLSLLSGDLSVITVQRDDLQDERDCAQRALGTALAERDILREERDQARMVLDKTVRRLADRTQVLDAGRAKLREFIANMRQERWDEQVAENGLAWLYQRPEKIAASLEEAVLGERVSTVTEASQAPVESFSVDGPIQPGAKVTVTIGGREIDAGGQIERMSLEEVTRRLDGVREEDDLAWARKFAEGGEA